MTGTGPGMLVGAFGYVAALARAAGLAAFWPHAGLLSGALLSGGLSGGHQSGLMVLAAITLTGMLVALLAQGARITAAAAAIPLSGRAAALRAKSWRAAFQPQRDPDAAGRARPRAPTGCPAAA
jgi:Family of unknown function (DUF6412)